MTDGEMIQRLRVAVASGSEDNMARERSECDTELLERGAMCFPETLFGTILELTSDPTTHRVQGFWVILRMLETHWESLDSDQRERLLNAVEVNFGRFTDWMTTFYMSEVIGTLYEGSRAYDVACKLYDSTRDESRRFVPHILEHVVTSPGSDDTLKDCAYRHLVDLRACAPPLVLVEVNESLARIANARNRSTGGGAPS